MVACYVVKQKNVNQSSVENALCYAIPNCLTTWLMLKIDTNQTNSKVVAFPLKVEMCCVDMIKLMKNQAQVQPFVPAGLAQEQF